jgi:hypothetical protein
MEQPTYIELQLVEPEFAESVMAFVEHKLPLAKIIRDQNDIGGEVDLSTLLDHPEVDSPLDLIFFKIEYTKLKAHIYHAWEHEGCEEELREEMKEFGIDKLNSKVIMKEIICWENDEPVVEWQGKQLPVMEIENVISAKTNTDSISCN